MQLRALKRMRYKGRYLEAGDQFAATERAARVFVAARRAEAVKDTAEPTPTPEPTRISERTGRPVRQYQRRDMQAE